MMIRIGKHGQALVDYTSGDRRYVIESSDVVLTQERERGAFERVVSDVHLVLDNFDGTFTALFTGVVSTSRFEVEVSEGGRVLFVGEIKNSSITFDVVDETVTCDVFSLDRIFWDATKEHRVKEFTYLTAENDTEFNVISSPLSVFLPTVFKRTGIDVYFSGYTISTLYSDRNIRGKKDGISSGDSNDGRLSELDPEMTVYELLTAFAVYYNAEFFIDPGTRRFTMVRRRTVVNDVNTDLTGLLVDDESISLVPNNDDKYDYISIPIIASAFVSPISSVEVVGWNQTVTNPANGLDGFFKWVITYKKVVNGITVESFPSRESIMYNLSSVTINGTTYYTRVTLQLPLGPAGTLARKVYRQQCDSAGNAISPYRLVTEVSDNTTATFLDQYPVDEGNLPPLLSSFLSASLYYIGYDEATGSWRTPIPNDGTSSAPAGKIKDLSPKLRFVSPQSRVIMDYNILDVVAFFGGYADFSMENIQAQWLDIFKSTQKMTATWSTLACVVGDSVKVGRGFAGSSVLSSDRLLVKRCVSRLMAEKSEMELVTL